MNLPTNLFDGNVNIQTFLCQPDKTIIGELLPYDFGATFKFNTYSEISFTVNRYYNDLIEGTTKINPCYDLIESIRVVYLKGIGHFIIQDVDESVSENDAKVVTCFSLEYDTGQKYLENFYVNTGEEGSVETMYHAQKYGAEYSIDNYYTKVTAGDKFDAYQRYYVKEYTDNDSYNYVEKQILNENDFAKYDGESEVTTLYVTKYPNVRFYWPSCPGLSLLHLVFNLIPEWKIGHVDKELWYQERTFSEDRTAIYDFLYNTAAETLKFVMVWDSIRGEVDFYKTTEDGVTADEEIETQWNTDVFIGKENLANSIDIKYSTDDIKTKLKITGSDDLDIRDVNLGQNYILNLSYYNTPLWMGRDLYIKYNEYVSNLETYTEQYKKYISDWSAAYNEYSDLMNYVPAEPRVMLIGDEFEKLYCVYGKYRRTIVYDENATYYTYEKGKYIEVETIPSKEEIENEDNYYYIENINAQVDLLQNKLHLYKVDQQDNGKRSQMAKTDDVLLTLENNDSDSATIRIRYDVDNESETPDKTTYCIYRTLTTVATGVSNTTEYTLRDWINGELTAERLNLSGFKVKSIGTLGAYLCLAKDETVEANIEDYGIKLLEEKQATYTKIFVTQTEGYMSQEGSQCIVSPKMPEGDEIAEGTKWLDSDTVEQDGTLIMKIYQGGKWVSYDPASNKADYENYYRFYENYQKLGTVQKVLAEKNKKATYLLSGVAINEIHLSSKNINFNNLLRVAIMHSVVLDNDYIISDTHPGNDVQNGTIWFQIDGSSLVEIRQYNKNLSDWVIYKDSGVNITITEYNKDVGYIVFTIGDDKNTYAVYVSDGTPYVSYAHSQGLCLAKMNVIKKLSDMNNYFTEQELIRLSRFIREDEYSDDNFLLTSYESEEEQMSIKQTLLEEGEKELKKLCQPKLSFDITMANILAIPEFAPIRKQFKLGNFIRIGIREGYVKRARLLEVQLNFDDPSDFSATFGDLISTKSEIDKHADLLKQAVTVSKSVASNSSHWQRGADKATELDKAINEGLKDAALSIGSANGQSIVWDEYGLKGRKLKEGTVDEYEDEQFALINNKLVFTDDAWKTSKAVIGEFAINVNGTKQNMYGLLADAVVGGYIQGTQIVGGNLLIGDGSKNYVKISEDGSIEIISGGKDKYAKKDEVQNLEGVYRFHTSLTYSNSTVFSDPSDSCEITCSVYDYTTDITKKIIGKSGTKFSWIRSSGEGDDEWNAAHSNQASNVIIITTKDMVGNAQFSCIVDFDESLL
jgi:hypothetical protein